MRRFVSLALVVLGPACLPVDTRPPPGKIEFTASSSALTRSGMLETVDGYRITFDRLLVDVGQPNVGNDDPSDTSCSEYSSPDYTRLFDFAKVEAPEEVGIAYAIGHCAVEFAVRFPDLDALLGTGASEADREFMRTPGSDAYAMDAGVSLYVVGTATSAASSKHFAWPFRERMGYRDCSVPGDDGRTAGIVVAGEGSTSVNIEMQAEALFRDQLDPSQAMLRFEPFANADTNNDGDVSLDELDDIPLSAVRTFYGDDGTLYSYPMPDDQPGGPPSFYCADSDGNPIAVNTLGDYAYCALAPSVARFQGTGACNAFTGRHQHD